MSAPTLSQHEIDALLSSIRDPSIPAATAVEPLDLRAPSAFDAALVAEVGELHKDFSRVMTDRLSRDLRVPVSVEQVGSEQLTYDAYLRSMPNPSLLGLVTLEPLPGSIVVEASTQLALIVVDRMLGGPGRPVPPRAPTRLEMSLLGLLSEHLLTGLTETFSGVIDVEPRLRDVELNPQFAHAAAPTETVLVLTFSVVAEAGGPTTRGLLSLCYPPGVARPVREAIRRPRWSGRPDSPGGEGPLAATLDTVPVGFAVRTRPTAIPAADLSSLAVGDVVRLDHAVDEPFLALIEGVPSLECDLGQRSGFVAARVRRWT